ncbi:MAG: replicative DNA helicase [Ruminococcus sp.]|nr:replicative DNA helicase [Ruminococcus sp.]
MADSNSVKTGYDGLNLPYSPEAEQAVLGAIIMDNKVLDELVGILGDSKYFYVATHRVIYSAVLDLFNSGKNVDFVTLLEALKRDRQFDDATGKTYLVDLAQNCPSVSNAPEYAKIVREKYDVRRLINASRDIIDEASAGESEPRVLIDSAEQKIFDIRRDNTQGLEVLSKVVLREFDRLDALNSNADDLLKPIPSGIGDLDRVITGLNRSDLILLAARPGMGKTSFALNIARYASCTAKKTIAFFSLEMTKEQLASRLISSEALVQGTKLRTGKLSDEEWVRIVSAGDVLSKCEFYLDDTPGITVAEIKSKLRRLKCIDLVVIDYLQLMTSGRRIDNRVQEVSEITRNLKILAKEMNVPVICLSQLNRAAESRPDHRPMLSDLRESGSIEQDADIILFLYRDAYYSKSGDEDDDQEGPASDENSGECIVAKNRHGETTTVKLHWQGEFMRFTSLERKYE